MLQRLDGCAREGGIEHLERYAERRDAHAREFDQASTLPARREDSKRFPKIIGETTKLNHRDYFTVIGTEAMCFSHSSRSWPVFGPVLERIIL